MRLVFNFFCLVFLASITILSCTDESDEVIVDERDEQYRLYDYYIDAYGNEGIVCYVDTSYTVSGAIIVISADEAYLPWGPLGDAVCRDDSVATAFLSSPSFGLSMLQNMTLKGIEHYPAMNWCANKNSDELAPNSSSWRLPTQFEFAKIFLGVKNYPQKIHSNLNELNNALKNIGATTIEEDNYYWTCNEDYNTTMSSVSDNNRKDLAIPITVNNKTTADKNYWIKKNKYYVRAIKYIYYRDKY